MNVFPYLFHAMLACPNCKNALDQQISAGYAWSIGLMMLIPLLIIGFWASVIFCSIQRSQQTMQNPA